MIPAETPSPHTPTGDPTSMLAITQHAYGGPEVLSYRPLPRPAPAKGEVLLRVDAAALDRGTWHLMTGLPRLVRLVMGIRRPRQQIPGRDVAGTVVAVGPEVESLSLGQRVFGIARGTFAEYVTAQEGKLTAIPARIPAEVAATLGISGLTALQALDVARVESGQRVLVIGASGGVGSYVVKLAVARGAQVTAVCSAAKADIVLAWGPVRVLDYATDDVTAVDASYDVIIDIAGGTALRRLRRILTPSGVIVFVGNETSGMWTGGFGRPMRNALRMLVARQRYVMFMARESAPADLARLAALVDDGVLSPHVHAVYPLADVQAAMTALIDGQVCGKVSLRVGAPVEG